MINRILIGALSLSVLNFFTPAFCNPIAQSGPLAPDPNIPDGYQVGMATVSRPFTIPCPLSPLEPTNCPQQDNEPPNQQSICTTNCPLRHPFATTAGPSPLPAGVFAAAIAPSLGGGADVCGPCGSCYSIITAGTPYCSPDPYDPGCGAPSGSVEQDGVKSVKVLITNHCTDCDNVSSLSPFVFWGGCLGSVG